MNCLIRITQILWFVIFWCGPYVFTQTADLSLIKDASATTVPAGSEQTYALTARNLGPETANTITVTDMLPVGSTFISASPECIYNVSLHQCDCYLDALTPLQPFIFNITIQTDWPPSGTAVGVYLTGTDDSSSQSGVYLLNTQDANRASLSIGALFANPRGITRESDTTLLIADIQDPLVNPGAGINNDGAIYRLHRGTGIQSLVSEGEFLVNPTGLAFSEGVIYVADPDSAGHFGRVLRVDSSFIAQTIVTQQDLLLRPTGICMDENGTLLVVDAGSPFRLVRVDPDTGDQTLISEGSLFQNPVAVALEETGVVVVADTQTGIVRVNLETGLQELIASPTGFEFQQAHDIEVAQNGFIYVADPLAFGEGAILQFNPHTGSMESGFIGGVGLGFNTPYGLELIEAIYNTATVSSDTTDPEPGNNTSSHLTEIRDLEPVQINVVENLGVSDEVTLDPLVMISVTESVAVIDQVTVTPSVNISVTETISVSDEVTFPSHVFISVLETINVSDLVTYLPSVQISVTEKIAVADILNVQPSVLISITEAISVSDIVEILEDLRPPTVVELRSIAANKSLNEGDETRRSITQIYALFSKPVNNPTGDSGPDDVTNPSNYILVSDGGDGVFDTVSCEGGPSPLDTAVNLGPIDYIPLDKAAVIRIFSGTALTKATYRLFVCGTTSIIDLQGQALDGDGDGTEGDDHVITFQVIATNLLANPNFDESLSDWDQLVPIGTNLEHATVDVTGLTTSGTARMTSQGSTGDMGLSQCLVTNSEGWIRMGGRLFMSNSEGVPEATVFVEWFDDTACEGILVDEWEVTAVMGNSAAEWFSFSKTGQVPDGAQSARFQIVVSVQEGEEVQAYWDELYFLYDPALILFDGLENGNLNNWNE